MGRPKKQINPEGYYTVYYWMPTLLGLSGAKLLIYAYIFAYSTNEKGKGCYFGGYEAMSLSVGCTSKNAQKVVQELSESGLIELKQIELENGLKRNYHRVSIEPLEKISDSVDSMAEKLEVVRAFTPAWEELQSIKSKIKPLF